MDNPNSLKTNDFADALPKDLRERIDHLFRYAQIGRCVNGLTHDVNNYLGAMLAYAELVVLDESVSEQSRDMLSEMIGAVRKCSDLVASMTGIARKEKRAAVFTAPAKILQRATTLRDYSLKVAGIKLETKLDDELPSIMVDPPKLVQALLYLLINAEEAVAGTDRPLVRVHVRDTGQAVEFRVWDSGPPIPEEERERIFRPFFTTKDTDHLGLGLPYARAVARLHDGELSYDPDRGFALHLPKENHLVDEP